jgi:cation diffusion facilitator CzcD-associated flavoprotein CzcO
MAQAQAGRTNAAETRRGRGAPTQAHTPDIDVAIVGAGPYGLAAAAHLRAFKPSVFGRPMSFWRGHMPSGMWLRSPRPASNISAPRDGFSLPDYEREMGLEAVTPLPLSTFVDYGDWFKDRTGANVEDRVVGEVARDNGHFRLTFDDGETRTARSVVIAAGIKPFAHRPPEFASLPQELVSHSVDHSDLSRFRGQKVLVLGAGQSAVEGAALLHEEGATVELLVRAPQMNWLTRSGLLHKSKRLRRMLYAPTDVGPAGVSWLIAAPSAYRRIPRRIQDPLAQRSIRAAASAWLVSRVEGVTIREGCRAVSATAADGSVHVTFDDGSTVSGDHLLLATGYRIDIARYPFWSPSLLEQVERVGGYPRLRRGFETSVPGLFILGAPGAWSHGPLLRFVAGTPYAAARLERSFRARRPSTGVRKRVRATTRPQPETG